MKKVFGLFLIMCLLFICSACAVNINTDLDEEDPTEEPNIIEPELEINEPREGPWIDPDILKQYDETYEYYKELVEKGEDKDLPGMGPEIIRLFIENYEENREKLKKLLEESERIK